jgi:hypothetical protein
MNHLAQVFRLSGLTHGSLLFLSSESVIRGIHGTIYHHGEELRGRQVGWDPLIQ